MFISQSVFIYYSCYVDRMKVLKKAKERDPWQSIDYRFMTDESEGENDKGEGIHYHGDQRVSLDALDLVLTSNWPQSTMV